MSWTKSGGLARNHGAISTAVSAPVATERRHPNGRQQQEHGQQQGQVLLARAGEGQGHDRPPGPVALDQDGPPHQAREQQRFGPRLVELGEGARGEDEQSRDGRCGPHPRPAGMPRGGTASEHPHTGDRDQRPEGQGPPHVTEQPPTRREQHGRPGQVGERVLDTGGAGPVHRVEVLAAPQPVGGLLQGHPDVDARPRRGDDRDGRTRGIPGHGQRAGRPGGAHAGAAQQQRAGQWHDDEERGGGRQAGRRQVAEQRHRQGRQRRAGQHHDDRWPVQDRPASRPTARAPTPAWPP